MAPIIWQFISAIVVAVVTTLLSPAIILRIINRRNKKDADDAKKRKDSDDRREREKQADDDRRQHAREVWMSDSEKTIERMKLECETCTLKLDRVSNAFYTALEDLEIQVIPMFQLPLEVDPMAIRTVMRGIIRKARSSAAWITTAQEP